MDRDPRVSLGFLANRDSLNVLRMLRKAVSRTSKVSRNSPSFLSFLSLSRRNDGWPFCALRGS
jgi:hypothetical protein